MKRPGIIWNIRKNASGAAVKAGAALWLSLLLCFAAECAASAGGKAYVAVFYRTFGDSADPEAADMRAALNEALEDAGIAYQEYDAEGDPAIQMEQIAGEKDAMLLIVNPAEQDSGDSGTDIAAQANGRPLIFFGCEIREETVDMTEDLCVLVNAEEAEAEAGPQEKNLPGTADVIALIAGNYMTGAGYFEGIETEWITDERRVDVPCLLSK